MADNRKYYYLKLKENFFDSDSIVLLEDMKDGILYSNILLKLYLKSLKNGGKLQLDENIPYTAQMIATLTRHQIGTVERALEIFRHLGLAEQLDSGAFYMTDIELMIGPVSYTHLDVYKRQILKLIRQWLVSGVLYGNALTISELGTSQGAVISPLLANIYFCLLYTSGI